MFLDTLEIFWTLTCFWKLLKNSGNSGKFMETLKNFPDTLENLQILWNVSGSSWKLSDTLESFWNPWKVSGHFVKFLDTLESLRTVCNVLDPLESVYTLWKVSEKSEIFLTLWNNSRYFGKFLKLLDISSTFWKASRISEKFYVNTKNCSVTLESLQTLWKTFWTLFFVSGEHQIRTLRITDWTQGVEGSAYWGK